jgi:hypothetical protein
MGWTNPRSWAVGEVVTAAIQNTHIRDLFRYLKGLDGAPTIESGLIIDNTDGDEYLKLPLLSTAEAATALADEGKVAFDEQTHDQKWHNGSAVISAKDAASLYIASQAAGDQLVASSASAWKRVAKGTANYYWRMKADASEPEWGQGIFKSKVIYGSRSAASGSGSLAVTGAGFAPNAAIVIAAYAEGAYACSSMGFVDSSADEYCVYNNDNSGTTGVGVDGSILNVSIGGVYGFRAVVATLDADGLTLTWTRYSSGANPCAYSILFLG